AGFVSQDWRGWDWVPEDTGKQCNLFLDHEIGAKIGFVRQNRSGAIRDAFAVSRFGAWVRFAGRRVGLGFVSRDRMRVGGSGERRGPGVGSRGTERSIARRLAGDRSFREARNRPSGPPRSDSVKAPRYPRNRVSLSILEKWRPSFPR